MKDSVESALRILRERCVVGGQTKISHKKIFNFLKEEKKKEYAAGAEAFRCRKSGEFYQKIDIFSEKKKNHSE